MTCARREISEEKDQRTGEQLVILRIVEAVLLEDALEHRGRAGCKRLHADRRAAQLFNASVFLVGNDGLSQSIDHAGHTDQIRAARGGAHHGISRSHCYIYDSPTNA